MDLLLESYRDSDWKLEDIAKIGGRGLFRRAQLSQDVVDSCSCYLATAFAACADAFHPKLILEKYPDFKARFKTAVIAEFAAHKADGRFIPGFGGKFADGTDGGRRSWNATFPDMKVASYATPVLSQKFNFAVSLGWAPFVGIYANMDSYADIIDGTLDNAPTGEKWGHGLRFGRDMDVDFSKTEFIDNYKKTLGKLNEYLVDLPKFRDAGGTMKLAYFFFPAK